MIRIRRYRLPGTRDPPKVDAASSVRHEAMSGRFPSTSIPSYIQPGIARGSAWLLHRGPNILLSPGTSMVAHLRENVDGAAIPLSETDLIELDAINT